jgi:hypothetical protein
LEVSELKVSFPGFDALPKQDNGEPRTINPNPKVKPHPKPPVNATPYALAAITYYRLTGFTVFSSLPRVCTGGKLIRLGFIQSLAFFFPAMLMLCACGSESGQSYSAEKRSILPWSDADGVIATNEFDSAAPDSSPASSSAAASSGASCASYVEGAPVGIACLQCEHPNAQTQALKIADILAQSCRRHIATTMLVDGTFNDNRDMLGEFVRIATNRGATLHLFLYLANGPWQRSYEQAPDYGVGTNMSPEEYRSRIISDPIVRAEYQERVKWALPLVSYAQSQGAIVYLIPMLEDNLDYDSARKMEDLTLETVPSFLSVALGRNPCPGCYPGNDASIPPGIFEDQHINSAYQGVHTTSGLVTNDGASVVYPHDSSSPSPSIPLDQLVGVISQAAARNNAFVLWRRDYQGQSRTDPGNRTYVVPSAADEQVLLQVLQTQF